MLLIDAIRVAVRRGATFESWHSVHAVAVSRGQVVGAAGDAGLLTFMRSAAKPFQALPLARDRPDLTPAELAIAAASHDAEPEQLAAVRSLLARAGATEDELECGPPGSPPEERLRHNCSGKHAGMLALCRAHGWPSDCYRSDDHPLQQFLLEEVGLAAELEPDWIPLAVDGCGVPTFAMPLERMAHAFCRLRALPGGAELAETMLDHPQLIGGARAVDTAVMRALPGWIAKRGAEGLLCGVSLDGLGFAVKVEDGANRAVRPALAAFLRGFGVELPAEVAFAPVRNSRGEEVGEAVLA
jgi:L-asparaginase II